MPADGFRIIEFRIPGRWILELRIAVWRPKAVSPLMVWVLIPPVRLGVVGRPWKPPNMEAMLGPPRYGGVLPARIWEKPKRAWKREVGVTVQV